MFIDIKHIGVLVASVAMSIKIITQHRRSFGRSHVNRNNNTPDACVRETISGKLSAVEVIIYRIRRQIELL